MYKIRKISFKNHPILKNLTLDFCDCNGRAVDTIILAGQNGTGKSAILDYLYTAFSGGVSSESFIELEEDDRIFKLEFYFDYNSRLEGCWVRDFDGVDTVPGSDTFKEKYKMSGIFSDVDINFSGNDISNVTSLILDADADSKRSSNNLPTQIKQLLVDIQTLDDGELSNKVRTAKKQGKDMNALSVKGRMDRFTVAFNQMFKDLTYSHIENTGQNKSILFEKYGVEIPIDSLSSGEKQIVYRGCFLLKDVAAMTGVFVFIDEPEISLHPTWQEKIMDYYKGIFTDEDGIQTSQIFAVTHSPFIIHNDSRRNDKVIVLARNANGDIVVRDKPEYYRCNSIEVVHDAFSIRGFDADKPTVYLEGRTDEKYFNKALEVFGCKVPFEFKWIGYIDEKGEEANTGKDALNKAVSFLASRQLPTKNVCLFDCDANKLQKEVNNVIVKGIPKFENSKGIKIGIENALVFGDLDIEPYKKQKIEIDGYAIEKKIPDFQKMDCCNYICSLNTETLKDVFANLKTVIDSLVALFRGNDHDARNQNTN